MPEGGEREKQVTKSSSYPEDHECVYQTCTTHLKSNCKLLTSTLLSHLCCSSISQLGKMRLLDVGSCFNPFLKFDEFLTVGIDIVPAVEV